MANVCKAIWNKLKPGQSWRQAWQEMLETSTDAEELRAASEYFATTHTWQNGESSFRAKFKPKGNLPPVPDTLLPEPPEAPSPEARVETPANVVELQNSIINLRAELADVRGQLASKTTLYDNLKRSMGLMAAQNIANVPNTGDQQSPIDIFNSMPDGPEKSEFYKAHQSQLLPFIITKPKAS
jgi:hypothetical protein